MSRIGNKIITLPAGVEVTNNNNVVTVKGPKGELTREFNKNIEIKVEGTEVTLHRPNDSKADKTIHGTSRANLNNMVVTVPNFKEQNLFFQLVNLTKTKLRLQKESLSKFHLLLQSSLAVSTKKLLVKQQLTSVAFVHQNLTKVKVSVTLVNTYVVKKVKLVNNRILSLGQFLCDCLFTISSTEQAL